ncbi:uncharacterized protein LOC141643125 [Silene latifolia]|uniref:uncharacterized protein LOC141643125 n=1 Tax=Silene latifolia TaxID=37657 RepID=UPI003D76BDBB
MGGLWGWICKAAMAVKKCKHRVKHVTEMCKKGLDVSRAAKAQVDDAVKMTAREIQDFISDDHVRDHVTRLLKDFSKNGVLFIVRTYGGGPIIDIVSQSIQDRKADSQMERLEELELKVAKLQWELQTRKTSGLAETSRRKKRFYKHYGCYSFNAGMNPKREELLREYLMKHLIVKFLNDPIVRRVRPVRNMKPVSSGVDPRFR